MNETNDALSATREASARGLVVGGGVVTSRVSAYSKTFFVRGLEGGRVSAARGPIRAHRPVVGSANGRPNFLARGTMYGADLRMTNSTNESSPAALAFGWLRR